MNKKQKLTYALVPARSGSKGVPDKNIRRISGHPLLAWSIKVALHSSMISRVFLTTNSEKYKYISR